MIWGRRTTTLDTEVNLLQNERRENSLFDVARSERRAQPTAEMLWNNLKIWLSQSRSVSKNGPIFLLNIVQN